MDFTPALTLTTTRQPMRRLINTTVNERRYALKKIRSLLPSPQVLRDKDVMDQ